MVLNGMTFLGCKDFRHILSALRSPPASPCLGATPSAACYAAVSVHVVFALEAGLALTEKLVFPVLAGKTQG